MVVPRVGLFSECYRPIQNGIVASVDALAGALRARGWQVAIVTPEMPGYRDEDDDVVRIPSLPLPLRTSYRLTLPLIAGEHNVRALSALSLIHTHSPFVTGWLGARLARARGVPLVFTYHTQLEAYAHYVPFEAHATRGITTRLTRAYANAADAVVVPTDAMERRLRALGVAARIEIVPSGIDVATFAAGLRRSDVRARLGAGEGDFLILCVARLGREKNLALALAALARMRTPRVRLAIVGEGAHHEALAREAARLGIGERVRFAGELARTALPDVYASSDAFVFPSQSETQGLVLVEALAAGVPVVAVDTPQTREVLGRAGAVAPADPGALALALDRALAAPRAEGAAREVARQFDAARLVARIVALYGELGVGDPEPARTAALTS
ncbi:MAG: glycosyltransferase [Vulcanimicrobiaceae bacterium]